MNTAHNILKACIRKMAQRRPFNVIVEGNIGSGKTTLLEHFKKYEDVSVQAEPLEQWTNFNGHNLLALMYKDAQKWSFSFESYVLLTMMQQHQHPTNRAVRLMERSLFSAKYIFVEKMHRDGNIPDASAAVLDEMFKFLNEQKPPQVDLIVYLRATPEVVHERMVKRNRDGENSVSLNYLQDLHEMHEDWLVRKTLGHCPAPVLVMNADLDKAQIANEYKKYEGDILKGIRLQA